MKFITVSILILLLLSQTFSACFVVMAFRLNREYIANNLCENRTKPQLNCKGNCVLMKKMKQEAEKEKQAPAALKIEINANFLTTASFSDLLELPVFDSQTSWTTIFRSGQPIDRSLTVFHPPSF